MKRDIFFNEKNFKSIKIIDDTERHKKISKITLNAEFYTCIAVIIGYAIYKLFHFSLDYITIILLVLAGLFMYIFRHKKNIDLQKSFDHPFSYMIHHNNDLIYIPIAFIRFYHLFAPFSAKLSPIKYIKKHFEITDGRLEIERHSIKKIKHKSRRKRRKESYLVVFESNNKRQNINFILPSILTQKDSSHLIDFFENEMR